METLTTSPTVVTMFNVRATLLIDERRVLSDDGHAFIELVLWRLPVPLALSNHPYKYRYALVIDGRCVVRYDNEINKGDHRHFGQDESPYRFTTPVTLARDFWNDVERWWP
jgi:hypothetical protein